MTWSPESAVEDFRAVAHLAGIKLPKDAITIELLSAPHKRPTLLPSGKIAVYVFTIGVDALKVAKVGSKSGARYVAQHYSAGSSRSNLARSLLVDSARYGGKFNAANIGAWICENVDRVNFLIDAHVGVAVLTLLEAFLQCRLNPRYEGFKSQRLDTLA